MGDEHLDQLVIEHMRRIERVTVDDVNPLGQPGQQAGGVAHGHE